MKQFRMVPLMIVLFAGLAMEQAPAQEPPCPQTPVLSSEELAKQPQTPGAKGEQQRHYYFAEAKEEMPYRLYVPQSYIPGKKIPLILALHGAGGPTDYFLHPGMRTQELCEKYGFIFVAPLGYHSFGGYGAMKLPRPLVPGQTPIVNPRRPKWNPEEEQRVTELSERDVFNVLDIVEKEYSIGERNIFLMGHSMGGFGTWYLAQKFPQKWAAIAPLSGGFGFVDYPVAKIKNIPVYAAAGSEDTALHGELARNEAARFRAAGVSIVYEEVPGGTHMSMIPPSIPKVFEFFAAHKR
jgi:predicted peptidase